MNNIDSSSETADNRHTFIGSCSSTCTCTKCIKTIHCLRTSSLSVFSPAVCYPEDKHTGPSVVKHAYRDKALARICSGPTYATESESAHLRTLTRVISNITTVIRSHCADSTPKGSCCHNHGNQIGRPKRSSRGCEFPLKAKSRSLTIGSNLKLVNIHRL